MSWNLWLSNNHPKQLELEEVVRKASWRGILMYCAASETKATKSEDEAWPTGCKETFSIGAASENRTRKDYVGSDAKYLFPSDRVLKYEGGRDGRNSAATALAAGLASLVLFCLKKNQRDEVNNTLDKEKQTGKKEHQKPHEKPKRPSATGCDPRGMMEGVFNSLAPGGGYVDIDALVKGSSSFMTIAKYSQTYVKNDAEGIVNTPRKFAEKGKV
jgi:hypothetical protein